MIRFEPRPEPDGFKERVKDPGDRWLAAHATGRPPDDWREFRDALADAFGSLCAYGAMFEPVGTVDHFVSIDEDRSQSYDWTNYRFSAAWINASKQSLPSSRIPAPENAPPTLQMRVPAPGNGGPTPQNQYATQLVCLSNSGKRRA